MIRQVRHMLELVRFSHTLFALPFAVLAAVMAWSENAHASPPVAWRWTDLAGILICMATARSAAMAFNRLADERIDAENPRTRGRHLPAGLLSRTSVVLFAAACSAGFIAATLLFLPNRLPPHRSRARFRWPTVLRSDSRLFRIWLGDLMRSVSA
jgi:4-hydroxybenzoate polyprenyltransferase